ncbi:MAG: TonB-dependent receptor plug domain-containing protein [Bacteroidia bacterium]|nr:TonB-dependent receptor plug domain-containing protein [Bacteroidia bacterium]
MKNRISMLLCVFLTVNSITGLYGQKSGGKITITGSVVIVVDGADFPVANAIIMVDGEKIGNVTDRKGFYKIKVRQENKKIGVYTFANGMIEEVLDGRNNINFTFKGTVPYQINYKADPGDEPVDIGYQTVKKKDLIVPVGKVDGTKSKYASYNTVYEMIRGEIPGVLVNGTSIMIRSATSINSGTEPLFVVDGVPVTTIDNIQPQMVRSIEVLKGSAASIYGSRGSNGVILINLLKGNDR